MQNADIQQEKDACKESMLKKKSRGNSRQKIGSEFEILYDNQLTTLSNSSALSCVIL